MARPRQSLTRDDYVAAAVRYTDEHGSDALTLRSLGDSLGVAHTALYRHFRDKAELVGAMANHVIREAAQLPVDATAPPEERIFQMGCNVRTVFMRHPHVAVATTGVATPTQTDVTMTAAVVRELELLGIPDDSVPVCYQMLETYVIATHAFDLSGTPHHLELRRQRHRLLGHPAFDAISRSPRAIEENNARAYELGLRAIIAACVAMGRGSTDAVGDTAAVR